MNVHEYQAKELFREYGVSVPEGELALNAEEAGQVAKRLGSDVVVVKAQVHAGGRGKGGGIKLARSAAEAKEHAEAMIGMTLVTPQTGNEGKLVRKVYVESGCAIERELYLAITLDRENERFAIIASTEGGMDIEEVAEKTPERIYSVPVDPVVGLSAWQRRSLGFKLGLDGDQVKRFDRFVAGLFNLYLDKDASLLEINPLVVTDTGELYALDGKLNFDDNALFRHPEIAAMRDPEEEDPLERAAAEMDFSYVALDGNIGCMVNGAGLAMATLDVISLSGGQPSNFLDVGGDADKARIENAFKLILEDKNVNCILVNIFGGIVRCDLIAQGVLAATQSIGLTVPLVVRLQGTNAAQGRQILADSGLAITSVETLQEAADAAVAQAKQAQRGS
jgi:succinyl-CoA synthetase beta subunit